MRLPWKYLEQTKLQQMMRNQKRRLRTPEQKELQQRRPQHYIS
jgi:hypothetical protein